MEIQFGLNKEGVIVGERGEIGAARYVLPYEFVGILDEAAGQSVFHCHMHLIPRYKGDVPNPEGGVRGVIPGKQKY